MLEIEEILKATGGKLICGRRNLCIKDFSLDSRTLKKGDGFIAIKGNNFDGHWFIKKAIKQEASCIITQIKPEEELVTKAKDFALIEVADTIKALGDIAYYKRKKFNLPIIAISGSNGKTTTKEMIAWILSEKFKVLKNEGTKNNHIGLPQALLSLNADFDLGVLELGTNHFHEIDYLAKISKANIGIITNIGPTHLEYFGGLTGVFKEKYDLIKNLENPYLGILNGDDKFLRKVILKKSRRPLTLSFSIENKSDFFASKIRFNQGKIEFLLNRKDKFCLNTCGRHNVYNALAAISVARIFGLQYKTIIKRLASFEFPAGRLEIKEFNKAIFIDDTYNSNPASFKQALSTLENFKTAGRKIVVMGDMLELGKDKDLLHRNAGRLAAQVADIFIAVGSLSKLAAEAARISGINRIFSCESALEARDILFNKVLPKDNDVILVKGSRSMKMEGVFI